MDYQQVAAHGNNHADVEDWSCVRLEYGRARGAVLGVVVLDGVLGIDKEDPDNGRAINTFFHTQHNSPATRPLEAEDLVGEEAVAVSTSHG